MLFLVDPLLWPLRLGVRGWGVGQVCGSPNTSHVNGLIDQSYTTTPWLVAQTGALKEIDSALRGEYTVRRHMLIERAKVTLQSFMWADRIQKSEGLKQPAQAAAQQGEALMHNQPAVTLDDIFRAKQGAYLLLFCLPSCMLCITDWLSAFCFANVVTELCNQQQNNQNQAARTNRRCKVHLTRSDAAARNAVLNVLS